MSSNFDPDRILTTLRDHNVEFIVVGGLSARARGAIRPTMDVDVVPATDVANLEHLATALIELNARLRVAGLTDDESRQLPVQLDALTLASFGSSTWMTDAGALDLLVELRDSDGDRHDFADLAKRSDAVDFGGIVVMIASIDDVIASKEYANRDKDRAALPELRQLRDEGSLQN